MSRSSARLPVGEVFEGGAAGEERDALPEVAAVAAVGDQGVVEEGLPEIAVEPGEVQCGIGDRGVGPVDDAGDRAVRLEDVLGAQVGVGGHENGRGAWL